MQGTAAWILSNGYTDEEIGKIESATALGFNYKGKVSTYENLPTTGMTNKDMYLVDTATTGHDRGLYAYDTLTSATTPQWVYVSVKGDQGEQGETGATGPAGQNGKVIDVILNGSSTLNSSNEAVFTALTDAKMNGTSVVSDHVALFETVDNVTSTSLDPLSANMGKSLQDEINNLKNIGRFLAIWNCTTGLPLTNPTTSPYTYKTGDYFRVGVAATGSKSHTVTMSGTDTSSQSFNVSFVFYDSTDTAYSTVATLSAALYAQGHNQHSGTCKATGTCGTYTLGYVASDAGEDVLLQTSTTEAVGYVLNETTGITISDTVADVTNYKPDGSSFTIGVASTVVETGDVEVGWVYYYDGTNWLAQSAGGGGTVQDVQINGTTILDSGSGVANIPITGDGTLGVASCSNKGIASTSGDLRTVPATYTALNNGGGNYAYHPVCASATGLATKKALGITLTSSTSNTTWTDAEATTARNTIGAYTVQTGTSAPSSLDEGVIYFVVED